MFWAVVTDIYTILFGIMFFALFLWIGILALRVIIGLLGAVSEYKPLLIIEQILGFYKIIPATFFLLGVCVAALGYLLNSIMGDRLDSLFEKMANVQSTTIKESALSANVPPASPHILTKTFSNSLGMAFVLIPAGSYPVWEEERRVEVKVVEKNEFGETTMEYSPRMVVSKPFYLSKFPVTQEQWVAVMGENPATRNLGRTNPVNSVSWFDAQKFIKALNLIEGTARYRLPTEAEWEYASRRVRDSGSHGDQRRGSENEEPYLKDDLYIYEWVQDRYGKLPTERETIDYHGPEKGAERVLQRYGYRRHGKKPGGGILDHSSDYKDVGFRLAFFSSQDNLVRKVDQMQSSATLPSQSQPTEEEITFIGTVETPGSSHGSLIDASDSLGFEMIPEIGGKIFKVCGIGDICKVTAIIDPDAGLVARLVSVERVVQKRSP